jgi:hypothetical protein
MTEEAAKPVMQVIVLVSIVLLHFIYFFSCMMLSSYPPRHVLVSLLVYLVVHVACIFLL